MRSSWKPKLFLSPKKGKQGLLRVFDRRSLVGVALVGRRVLVYTGRRFISLLIRPWHVNKSLGIFVLSKKMGKIHKVVKKVR